MPRPSDQFRFISHRTTNNVNWHHILSKLQSRFMVIVRHRSSYSVAPAFAPPFRCSGNRKPHRPFTHRPLAHPPLQPKSDHKRRILCCCWSANAAAAIPPSCQRKPNLQFIFPINLVTFIKRGINSRITRQQTQYIQGHRHPNHPLWLPGAKISRNRNYLGHRQNNLLAALVAEMCIQSGEL